VTQRFTYRDVAKRIRERDERRAALNTGAFPTERQLMKLQLSLDTVIDLLLVGRASGVADALEELDRE
jgi:hypothetical protein